VLDVVIDFDLEGLHPSFERPVVDILNRLDVDYPIGALRRVTVRPEKPGDESMASADKPGEIVLHGRWFGRPIEELQAAARYRNIINLRPTQLPIAWHGDMAEPDHVLSHEFGHCLQDVLPEWQTFAQIHWLASCQDPVHCWPVSGYALVGINEWWADTFAAMRLNILCEATRLMRELLSETLKGKINV
jgi:hypothetical protein